MDVEGATAFLYSLDGSRVVIEIKSADLKGEAGVSLEAPFALFESRPEWEMEELQSRGLPPEWNRAWFLEQWFTHQSIEAVHEATGRPVDSLSRFAGVHRIEGEFDEYITLLWKRGDFKTFSALAKHLDTSTSTVSRVLGRTTKADEKVDSVREALAEVRKLGKLSRAKTVREVTKLLHERGDHRSEDRIATLVQRINNEPVT